MLPPHIMSSCSDALRVILTPPHFGSLLRKYRALVGRLEEQKSRLDLQVTVTPFDRISWFNHCIAMAGC